MPFIQPYEWLHDANASMPPSNHWGKPKAITSNTWPNTSLPAIQQAGIGFVETYALDIHYRTIFSHISKTATYVNQVVTSPGPQFVSLHKKKLVWDLKT